MKVTTPKGDVELLPVPSDLLSRLHKALPLGLFQGKTEDNIDAYGIVTKRGEEESFFVKQQPVEVPEDALNQIYLVNSILIAKSLQRYRDIGYGGCLLISQYIRRKEERVESGIAYFGSPSGSGTESNEFPYNGSYDGRFGHGFTTMFSHFIRELKGSASETGLPLQPCIGLEIRPRSELEIIGFQFLVHGSEIYFLKPNVSEKDPIWAAIRSTGIESVYHLPSVPGEISGDDLAKAKSG